MSLFFLVGVLESPGSCLLCDTDLDLGRSLVEIGSVASCKVFLRGLVLRLDDTPGTSTVSRDTSSSLKSVVSYDCVCGNSLWDVYPFRVY